MMRTLDEKRSAEMVQGESVIVVKQYNDNKMERMKVILNLEKQVYLLFRERIQSPNKSPSILSSSLDIDPGSVLSSIHFHCMFS
jgi:hypothetical protein